MDNINMQELISFINWEELRIWLLFLFGIIGGVITIRSFSLNNEQKRIDNTFKVLDFLRRNISKEQINAFITLFQANNPLGVPYDEFHFRNGKTEKVSDMFSEGGCGNGDIHNMIELFELIAPLLIKKQINENLIWYEYGLIMDKCYDWIIVINENNTPSFNKRIVNSMISRFLNKSKHSYKKNSSLLFPYFSKYMKDNQKKNLNFPYLHYTYAE